MDFTLVCTVSSWPRTYIQIPFKGTGKEYIGDDIEEMHKSVKAALNRCCKQLKQHLLTRLQER